MFYRFSLFVCSLLITVFLTQGEARWSKLEEADSIVKNYERTVLIKANGQSEEIVTTEIKILNEEGRARHGIHRDLYNENIEKITILKASVTYEGKTYTVPKKMIEVKPIASSGEGFDQLNQIFIAFPKVGPGTDLHLKYRIETKHQPLPRYYAKTYSFGDGVPIEKAKISIKSELPLFKVVNDIHDNLTVTETKDKKHQTITITLNKPVFELLTNESALLDPKMKTWINISTFNRFEDLGNALANNFENVLQEDLPPLFETIRLEAEKAKTPVEQLNKVSSMLAERIRYMGDWRTIKGRFVPHSLKEIVKSGVGDCKDFSVSMGAILSKMGYEVHSALVWRGEVYIENPKALPSMGEFNHAILYAKDKTGKVYWLDPTNMVSMADGLFPDICNRKSLILTPEKATLGAIPNIDPHHAVTINEKTLSFKKEKDREATILSTQGIVTFKGENALFLTGAALTNSPQFIGEELVRLMSRETSPLNQKIELPDLTSRIVVDLKVPYVFDQENVTLLTNEGTGLQLDASWCKSYLRAAKDQIGTLYVGYPNHSNRKIIIKDVKINHMKTLEYDLKTPWVDSSRIFKSVEGGVEMIEETTIKTGYITGEEVRSPEFNDFKNKLKKYLTQVAAVFETPVL